MTDLPDRLPQRPPVVGAVMPDVLSDVLHAVRLTGSMLFLVEATAPFMSQAPATRTFAAAVLPTAQHLISYHVVTEGRCWAGLAGEAPQPLQAGDILVVPHGDPYFLAAPANAPRSYSDDDAVAFFRRMAAGELPTVINEGGGGETTRFICGFLGCDTIPFNPVLAALPRVIRLRGATGHGERMAHLVAFALEALREPRAGSREVLLRLSELMFVEVVRCQLADLAGDHPDWLTGLRDPLVSRALACLHGQPEKAWTLASLAASASTSRTTLAEHFARHVGRTPMQYLSAWRMQLASRMLADGGAKVSAVAEAVGYDSEAAFSRAFKRQTGLSPSNWRRR